MLEVVRQDQAYTKIRYLMFRHVMYGFQQTIQNAEIIMGILSHPLNHKLQVNNFSPSGFIDYDTGEFSYSSEKNPLKFQKKTIGISFHEKGKQNEEKYEYQVSGVRGYGHDSTSTIVEEDVEISEEIVAGMIEEWD